MKKILCLVVILLFARQACAKILLYDDCEDFPNTTNDWKIGNNPQYFSVSADTARKGSKSYKFVLPPYGTPGVQSDTEIVCRALDANPQVKNFLYGVEYWVAYSLKFPAGTKFPVSSTGDYQWGLSSQFHSAPDACELSPVVLIRNPNAAFFFNSSGDGLDTAFDVRTKAITQDCTKTVSNYDEDTTPNLIRGGWNDIVINFKFNYENVGNPFFKVWMNGAVVADFTGPNCYSDAKGPYWVIGVYKNDPNWTTVYYDEIRVGDENESYASMSLAGGVITPPSQPEITTASLGTFQEGQTSTGTITATSGTAPYVFTSTNKPAWFTLNTNGTWSATPPTDGQYAFTVTCTDANNNSVQKTYSGLIADTTPPVVGDIDLQISVGGPHSVAIGGGKTITAK